MAVVELPFSPSIGQYTFTATIETVQYVFNVRWNTRDSAWYFDVLEADTTPIVYGLKIVLGTYIGRRTNHPLFNDGVIVAVDLSGQETDAGFDDLGIRVALQYIPALDLIIRLGISQ